MKRGIVFILILLGITLPQIAQTDSKWQTLFRILTHQVGVPYHFGGETPHTGFDCSGLVRYAYAKIGTMLPHSTQKLRYIGKKIPLTKLRRGDLIFFSPSGHISHVGIYLGHGVVIHAPSTGKNVTVMDVFHHVYWEHEIAFARRVLPNL